MAANANPTVSTPATWCGSPSGARFFGLDGEAPEERQIAALQRRIESFDPALARRLPVLGPAVGLSIPDNDLTLSFDAKLRKSSLETLLADVLTALARELPLLIVIEDAHWLDPLSHDLLEVIARSIADLPVLILLAYRPVELDGCRRSASVRCPITARYRWRPSTRTNWRRWPDDG